jgi:hypothetical protein
LSTEQFVDQSIQKVSRTQMGGAALGSRAWMSQTKLTIALLQELRHSYVTFPLSVRKALEEYLRG